VGSVWQVADSGWRRVVCSIVCAWVWQVGVDGVGDGVGAMDTSVWVGTVVAICGGRCVGI
jgi:hypothetical protein